MNKKVVYVSGGKILDVANKIALKTLNMQYPETKTQEWLMSSGTVSFRKAIIRKDRCVFVGNVSTFSHLFADLYIRVLEKIDGKNEEVAQVRIRMKLIKRRRAIK